MRSLILCFSLFLLLVPASLAQDDAILMNDARGITHRVELHPETGSARWIHNPDLNIAAFERAPRALNAQLQPALLEHLLTIFGDILQVAPSQTQLHKADTDGAAWFVTFD